MERVNSSLRGLNEDKKNGWWKKRSEGVLE